MSQKTWAFSLAGILFGALVATAGFNFWMDPYMTFDHSHAYNNRQTCKTEAFAKSYHLYKNPGKYRQILLGGSSAAHINVGADTFNFAASGFTPQDADLTVQSVLKYQPQVKKIIIGLDGFHYLTNFSNETAGSAFDERVTNPLTRYQNLLSWRTLEYSVENFLNNFREAPSYLYDRQFRVHVDPQPKVSYPLSVFQKNGLNRVFADQIRHLKSMKTVEIAFYTSPMSEEWLRAWLKKRKADYENWLRILVKEAGAVEHFAWLSDSVRASSGNFTSDTHFYTPVGDKLFSHLSGNRDEAFGVTLTVENVDEELKREFELLTAP